MGLFFSTLAILFVIMDPPGNVPIFLGLTRLMNKQEKIRAATQSTLVSLCIITVFAIGGRYILEWLGISPEALQLSGGVLLFLVAMELLMGKDDNPDENVGVDVNVALVPLGTPLLAGPGTIVAVMLQVQKAGHSWQGWIAIGAAVVIIHIIVWLILRFSLLFEKILGESGIILITRIAGLLLAAIATQMAMEGLFTYIRHSGILV